MLKMFCSRDMALFTYPGYPWQFSWTASTATVRYYPDKQSRSHPRIARINEVAATVEKRTAAWLGYLLSTCIPRDKLWRVCAINCELRAITIFATFGVLSDITGYPLLVCCGLVV